MNTSLTVTIDLELTQPVSGSISSNGGQPARFSGWLEMHSILEEMCLDADREPASPDEG